MASPSYGPLSFLCFLTPLFLLINTVQPLCHGVERSALLQFMQSFSISNNASISSYAYPKTASWKIRGESSDCCLWDGVECDEDTGYVIGLDLGGSSLHGSINSTSSLFQLVHLRRLNLGGNDFNYSQVPSRLALLSSLTYLNLSNSMFYGEIPLEITELSHLTSLDLARNLLELGSFDLRRLAQNLTGLEQLDLSSVNISSTVPDALANLSSLTFLNLEDCNLQGLIPSSFGDLTKLGYLNLGHNNFSGQVPLSLANLTQLEVLSLSQNSFISPGLSWLGNLNKIRALHLSDINLAGEIPLSLRNMTRLSQLHLSNNRLTGKIPLWISNLTQLKLVHLRHNELQGPIPESVSKLVNLEELKLEYNQLSGTIEFSMFASLKHLTVLQIRRNNLTVLTNISDNTTLPKFKYLALGDCNLSEFPDFLRSQDELIYLHLGRNRIQGQIPKWLGDIASLIGYSISSNSLTGEILPSLCNLRSLGFLDLSYNKLSGMFPNCLGDFSDSLLVLNLSNNFFHGRIPQAFRDESNLRMIDLSHNQLEGQLPRSLTNCRMMEILDLSYNRISDKFPFWLANLPKLQVLILRSNQFFGSIKSPGAMLEFRKLQIIDLSYNNFTGILPSEFFQTLRSMRFSDPKEFAYMQTIHKFQLYEINLANKGVYMKYWQIPNVIAAIDLSSNAFRGDIPQSIGTLEKVNALNLSNNHLSGDIPSVLGNLANLESLDLSQNMLSGEIPQHLTQLTFLAYFNVSHNQLEGPIPQGKQFNTFDNSSYEGNSGLYMKNLPKKSECSEPPQPPNLPKHQGFNNILPKDIEWIAVAIGYGSGLVVGVVVGLRVSARIPEWFVKTFGKTQGNRRRREVRGVRRR
ncbi:receptor-like protein 6 [Populus alba x Populus x berolinensis]|uniref:Receptor-like protein 6 n=1 Tax=Populus alba x Populus x berolinensis TaxID=444605 RepID=A0AAD6RT89_9ROSI|nr:receptor-like protein 6 [Populus alba x Populus x berolinensis]